MTDKELKIILENHLHWINKDVDGWENMRANLSGANLSYVCLKDTNLSGANLSGVNISYTNLFGSNLEEANLEGARIICWI